MGWRRAARAVAAAACLIATAPGEAASGPTADTPEPYLDPASLPQGAAFLPPPPPYGSGAWLLDQQVFLQSRLVKQRDPGRWALAASDARLDDDHLLTAFACGLGVAPDRATMPGLYRLLDRAGPDTRAQTDAAKTHFARPRPYLRNHQPICVPRFTDLDRSPAYPSGHATLGMGLGLILAELVPDRSSALLARGRSFGESRIVCGVHWLSDVQAGYLNAAALVAALHASAAFRADLGHARDEIAAARGHDPKPPDAAACAAEQDAASHSILFQSGLSQSHLSQSGP